MAKVMRLAKPRVVLSWEMVAAVGRTRPFAVALLGASGCVTGFTAATAEAAEAYAVAELNKNGALFGAVVSHGMARPVSRVLPL